jgi:predicted acyl esterase
LLHLRGNIQGYLNAGSKFKYLRAIVGRHDLPFYYKEEVEIQRSFLDAFLKGEDRVGWSVPGKVPAVDIVLRKGNPGFNNAEKEKAFPRRTESEWPIARTKYTNYYLTSDGGLSDQKPSAEATISYEAPGYIHSDVCSNRPRGSPVTFTTAPFEQETEVTGHVVAHLNVSCSAAGGNTPSDIDLFVTIRHYGADGKESISPQHSGLTSKFSTPVQQATPSL